MAHKRNAKQLARHREYMKKYLHDHPEYTKRQNNLRLERQAANRPMARRSRKKWYRNLKNQLFELLGASCACCGEDSREFLGIDHINGGGGKHRKAKRGAQVFRDIITDPDAKKKYRVLCHNCNLALGFYGYCPHEKTWLAIVEKAS